MAEAGDKLVLGTDLVATDKLDFKGRTVGATKVVTKTTILLGAKTVVWNGPVGVFEIDATAKGTIAMGP